MCQTRNLGIILLACRTSNINLKFAFHILEELKFAILWDPLAKKAHEANRKLCMFVERLCSSQLLLVVLNPADCML